MKYCHRLLEDKVKSASQHFPVVMVTGARQVGKSTLLQHYLPDAQHVTFDPNIDIGNARHDPELFIKSLKTPVILDEFQFSPDILSVIKRFVDKNKQPGQFFLTGSQNFSSLRHVSESLAGRVAILSLNTLSLGERFNKPNGWLSEYLKNPHDFLTKIRPRLLADQTYSFNHLLWRGMYPGLLDMPNEMIPNSLDGYFRTYVERDIRVISDIDNLQEFSRFAALMANLTAQEINYSQLGRDIGITPQTARRWLNILISSYQWTELPNFSGNTIKRISQKPKGYFTDTGMACHLMHISTPDTLISHPNLGALFETFVVQDIIKQFDTLEGKPATYHWRSHGGAEVDLILQRDGRYYPIEIKLKSQPTKKDARGIQAFRETYPHLTIEPGIIIAPVDHSYPVTKDCYVIPYDLTSLTHKN